MHTLRKIDWYAQLTISVASVFSIPLLFLYGLGAGLFLMGFWQLLSAVLNSSHFIQHGLQQQIIRYWKLAGSIMAALFLCFILPFFFDGDDVQVGIFIAVAASIPVALFYLKIYRQLIENISLRNEIDGLTKSKH